MKKDYAITGLSFGVIFSIIQFGVGFFDKKSEKTNNRLSVIEFNINELKMKNESLESNNKNQQDFIVRNRGKIETLERHSIENYTEIKNMKDNLANNRYGRKK